MRILSYYCLNVFSFFISSYIGNCTLALWYKIKSGRSIKLNLIELLSKKILFVSISNVLLRKLQLIVFSNEQSFNR